MLRTSIKSKNTRIIVELNNVYENFKIANFSQQNTKAIDNKESRNF